MYTFLMPSDHTSTRYLYKDSKLLEIRVIAERILKVSVCRPVWGRWCSFCGSGIPSDIIRCSLRSAALFPYTVCISLPWEKTRSHFSCLSWRSITMVRTNCPETRPRLSGGRRTSPHSQSRWCCNLYTIPVRNIQWDGRVASGSSFEVYPA